MLIVEEGDKVTVNSNSPGVAEMVVGDINRDPDAGTTPMDDDEDDNEDELTEAEQALERILGAKRELDAINRISAEMAQTGLVSKEQRLALEAFDTDGVLPHKNAYTADPSRINYEATNDFVKDTSHNVACNTYNILCKNMAEDVHDMASTLSELPNIDDVMVMVKDHKLSLERMMELNLPSQIPTDVLDNKVLDEGLRMFAGGNPDDNLVDELLECKEALHEPSIVMGNRVRLLNFIQRMHEKRMSGLTFSAAIKFGEDYEEMSAMLTELLERAKDLDNYQLNNGPNQNPLALLSLSRGALQPPDELHPSTKINYNLISENSVRLLYNPNNELGEIGLPTAIKTILDRFVVTMNATMTEPENPQYAIGRAEVVDNSVKQFGDALNIYITMVEKLVTLIKRSTYFYDEIYKVIDVAIQEAQSIYSDTIAT